MADDQLIYIDEEFALILRQASELASRAEPPGTSSAGFTLTEMKAAAAQAQQLTASVGFGTIQAIEVGGSFPLSDQVAVEPFATVDFPSRGPELTGLYGAKVRARIPRLTTPDAYAYMTLGGGGFYSSQYGVEFPFIGSVGMGAHKRLSPRVALRSEAVVLTYLYFPVGLKLQLGVAIDLKP